MPPSTELSALLGNVCQVFVILLISQADILSILNLGYPRRIYTAPEVATERVRLPSIYDILTRSFCRSLFMR